MNTTPALDFSLVANLTPPGAWGGLPSELASELIVLPETHARAEGAEHFAWCGAIDMPGDSADPARTLRRREMYLRAALSEFASMEYALRIDRPKPSDVHKIRASANPLLHVVRALRDMNVHLASSRLAQRSRPAVWPIKPDPVHFDFDLWVITELEPGALGNRTGVSYASGDVQRLIDWFMPAQAEWGVHHLVRLAVLAYSREVLSKCCSAV